MDTVRRYSMLIDGGLGRHRRPVRDPLQRRLPVRRVQAGGLGRELGPHALDEYPEEKFVHLDLSGCLDRRAYALLLSTPPD
jgi:hypothetical protein